MITEDNTTQIQFPHQLIRANQYGDPVAIDVLISATIGSDVISEEPIIDDLTARHNGQPILLWPQEVPELFAEAMDQLSSIGTR